MTKHEIIDNIMGIKELLADRWPEYPGCERQLLERLTYDTLCSVLYIHQQDLERNSLMGGGGAWAERQLEPTKPRKRKPRKTTPMYNYQFYVEGMNFVEGSIKARNKKEAVKKVKKETAEQFAVVDVLSVRLANNAKEADK